jgi:hypothetical protein
MHPNALPADDSLGTARVIADLIELQLLDAISGQTDRGSQNFFFRKPADAAQSNVIGIDLDMAFGALATLPNKQAAQLPPFVWSDTARRLSALSELRVGELLALFPAATRSVLFQDALFARLRLVQAHLAALAASGAAVELAAIPRLRADLNSTNSYYGRLKRFNDMYATDACKET